MSAALTNRYCYFAANHENSRSERPARSQSMDAGYATEISQITKAQILQQAGTSVLAQANQVPQGVLSLLQ
ncbi:flagellin [Salinicola sp. V024]|uniref:flagellin n=1 Tax=Salinicola sp. V024 TaxID=3459609 RepID=UPI0040447B0C